MEARSGAGQADWLWNFDIDKYLNPFIPRSRLHKLPRPLGRLLGYRETKPKVSSLAIWSWGGLGAFCGIALIECVYKYSPVVQSTHPPVIIGSFGAAAILEYNTIESPLAQPRNMVLGQLISGAVGISIAKLFLLIPNGFFYTIRWTAGALAVGVSSFAMGLTKTVHPPAGATALLAVTSNEVLGLGWTLLPLLLLGNVLMLASACLINNVQRQFPVYWWTPANLGPKDPPREASDAERASNKDHDRDGGKEAEAEAEADEDPEDEDEDQIKVTRATGASSLQIRITAGRIDLPKDILLSERQLGVLEDLQGRLERLQRRKPRHA